MVLLVCRFTDVFVCLVRLWVANWFDLAFGISFILGGLRLLYRGIYLLLYCAVYWLDVSFVCYGLLAGSFYDCS